MQEVTELDWQRARNSDGSLDLLKAYYSNTHTGLTEKGAKFLDRTQQLRPIRSRQVAAVALALASVL